MNTPNIFAIATSELSQDAFITWLLKWADDKYSETDKDLSIIGKRFVTYLLRQQIEIKEDINSVTAGRQWQNIDIWAEVNDNYILIIEDKINTTEHDNQLQRYKKTVEEEYKGKRTPVFIYLKTGLESIQTTSKIQQKGWACVNRKSFLQFLTSYSANNNIYKDYVDHLQAIEKETNSYTLYTKLNSPEATKGLYYFLQNSLGNEYSHWDYVPNPSGGFIGFWFHFISCANNEKRELYLQIENTCKDKINLFVKICGTWNHKVDYLYQLLKILKQEGEPLGLKISKPSRYKPGEYTSVAIINDVFIDNNNYLDLNNCIAKLKLAMKLVDNVTTLI